MLLRSYSRLTHTHLAQQHQMRLIKYFSHYVTHSNSLSSDQTVMNVPTVSGGVSGCLKIDLELSDSHSSQVILRTSTLIKSVLCS